MGRITRLFFFSFFAIFFSQTTAQKQDCSFDENEFHKLLRSANYDKLIDKIESNNLLSFENKDCLYLIRFFAIESYLNRDLNESKRIFAEYDSLSDDLHSKITRLASLQSIQGKEKEYDESIMSSREALSSVLEIDHQVDRQNWEYFFFRKMAQAFRRSGEYDSALHYSLRLTKMENSFMAVDGFNIAGIVYASIGEFDKSVPHFRKAVESIDEYVELHYLRIVSQVFNNLGAAFIELNKLDSADIYLSQSLSVARELKDDLLVCGKLVNLGYLASENGNNELGRKRLFEAIGIAEQFTEDQKANYYLNTSYENLAEIELADKNAEKALGYALISKRYADKSEEKDLILESYFLLAKVYDQQKDYRKGLEIQREIRSLEKELLNIEKLSAIEEIETKYETEKKEQEIASLSQQNMIKDLQLNQQRIVLIVAAMVLLLVVLVAFLLNKQRKDKAEKKQLKMEQHLLRSQMNPHFIFNALTSIQNLILGEKNDEAVNYLSRFGELTRDILESSRKELITFSRELSMLENYVKLESAGFEDQLELKVSTHQLEIDDFLIPPMILQPFVENAIKHGFEGKSSGEITIELKPKDGRLYIRVEDNGVGLNDSQQKERESLAIQIVSDRLLGNSNVIDLPKIENRYSKDNTLLGVVASFNLPLIHAY